MLRGSPTHMLRSMTHWGIGVVPSCSWPCSTALDHRKALHASRHQITPQCCCTHSSKRTDLCGCYEQLAAVLSHLILLLTILFASAEFVTDTNPMRTDRRLLLSVEMPSRIRPQPFSRCCIPTHTPVTISPGRGLQGSFCPGFAIQDRCRHVKPC